ncbi:hypothetical protein V5799_002778 [Amblyomma americanum]|uniref:Secreted protein n=1 Tax=Amblyomma americanum TaxID=6943 RepID=A0AAQ4DAV0_AMBAM
MGRACRIVNEPPPTGSGDVAMLAAALLLMLNCSAFEEDSEESDDERLESKSDNGDDGGKAGHLGRPQPPPTRAPIAAIEEIGDFDSGDQPADDKQPATSSAMQLRRHRRQQPCLAFQRRAPFGSGPTAAAAAAAGGQEKRHSCTWTQGRLELA